MSNTQGNLFGLVKKAALGHGKGKQEKVSDAQIKSGATIVDDMYNNEEKDEEKQVKVRKKNAQKFVSHFYDIVTDFYETGWGQSFHFAPRGKLETFRESIVRHEHYLALKLNLNENDYVLDAGCGIGGPMRNIAQFSGCKILGLTINGYQVQRGNTINESVGLSDQCELRVGDFCNLKEYKDNTFDKAFAVEATCHAPDRLQVFSEIYRVLKPGGLFGTYEWVLNSDIYDPENKRHVEIKHMVEKGNALPEIIPEKVCLEKFKQSGFELLESVDLDRKCRNKGQLPWHGSLEAKYSLENIQHTYFATWFTHCLCWFMETVKLAPKGTFLSHQLLFTARNGLVEAGNLQLMTPMYLLIGRKPHQKKNQQKKESVESDV